ncbi:hypothetical protein ACU3L3_07285 [Priestia endophytica]
MSDNTAMVLINLGVLTLTGVALVFTHSLWSLVILLFIFSKTTNKTGSVNNE